MKKLTSIMLLCLLLGGGNANADKSEMEKAAKTTNVSNNILNRTFNCTYPGGSSKIIIKGGTATEITSAGVNINYLKVDFNEGAFTLSESSKDGRSWFIGGMSILLLDIEIIRAKCR